MRLFGKIHWAFCLVLIFGSEISLSALTLELDNVVVTGTRTEKLSRESPVRTEVVSEEEILTIHARDLKEALQYMPGLQLREIHGKSGYEVWIQGLSADRVLILLDGMPITPTTGSSVDVTQLSMIDVERVEVVKGATSALYGSAAMGGVVNLISKPIASGLHGEVTGDAGTYFSQNPNGDGAEPSAYHGRVRGSVGSEQWRLRFAIDENSADGIDPDPDTWKQPGDEITRQNIGARLEWLPSKQDAEAYLQLSSLDETTLSRFVADNNANNILENNSKSEALDRLRIASGVSWQSPNRWRWSLDGLQETLTDDTRKENHSFQYHYDFREADFDIARYSLRLELPQLANQIWMFGFDLSDEALNQVKSANSISAFECELEGCHTERDGQEFFIQDDLFFGENWELLIGARYQKDSDFGNHFAPKFNLRYQYIDELEKNIFFRLGWGGVYRVPNLKERFFVFDHSNLGYMVLGNPELKPEESSSWQFGIGMQWQENLTIDINFFYNDLSDLIQADFEEFDSSGVQLFRYHNLDKAQTKGAEMTGRWRYRSNLNFSWGYTFLEAKDKATEGDLTRRPQHQMSLGMDWLDIIPGLKLSVRARGQSHELVDSNNDRRSPGWVLVDLKLNKKVNDNVQLFSGLDNVLNRQRDFETAFDFAPVAGRFFYVGFRVRY